jgi:DNA polymerase
VHKPVPAFWGNLERAAHLAILNPGKKYRIGYLKWCYEKDFLTVELPIGRKLYYFKPTLEKKESLHGTQNTLHYYGMNRVRKFVKMSTWGGKLTENVVQACARDLLYEALLRLENTSFKPVLAVHDEIVCETGYENNENFVRHMSELPEWAKGFPMKVEGWCEQRYRK